ncbi:MAG: RDD family protein, partial [Anaerolineales bacterium]
MDLPLRLERAGAAPETATTARPVSTAAKLKDRAMAFAADAATVVLVIAIALLAAVAVRGHGPRLPGLAWAAVFGFYFSFFASVPPLLLFGKTVGLALTGLRVREGAGGRGLTVSEAVRRWLGT